MTTYTCYASYENQRFHVARDDAPFWFGDFYAPPASQLDADWAICVYTVAAAGLNGDTQITLAVPVGSVIAADTSAAARLIKIASEAGVTVTVTAVDPTPPPELDADQGELGWRDAVGYNPPKP